MCNFCFFALALKRLHDIIIIIKYETDYSDRMTLSQPNVAGALYKVSEDMPMSVDA